MPHVRGVAGSGRPLTHLRVRSRASSPAPCARTAWRGGRGAASTAPCREPPERDSGARTAW